MNKCESFGFKHAWKDITPDNTLLTYPTQHPSKTEECINCGLKRILMIEYKEWWKYSE